MKDSSSKKEDLLKKTKKPLPHHTDEAGGKRDNVFKIKIADLLNETGRQDEVVFEHKFSAQLPNLDTEGVAGSFTIQSLDNTSLLGTLADIHTTFHEVCDSCGTSFLRSVEVASYTSRFVSENELKNDETPEADEVLFYIDAKSETINIEDMVVQAILLDDPFVKRCAVCTQRLANIDDDEELDTFESKGNIVFS